MRYVLHVFLLVSFAFSYEQRLSSVFGMKEQNTFPAVKNSTMTEQRLFVDNPMNVTFDVIQSRPKRSAAKMSVRDAKKLRRRKSERLKLKRYIRKELWKAEKKRASLLEVSESDLKRQSREDDSIESHDVTKANQNELLASIDDLPKRSPTVEISIKDPGMCKVDGVPMCKNGGECMSRVSDA